jgi:hypothetical protein
MLPPHCHRLDAVTNQPCQKHLMIRCTGQGSRAPSHQHNHFSTIWHLLISPNFAQSELEISKNQQLVHGPFDRPQVGAVHLASGCVATYYQRWLNSQVARQDICDLVNEASSPKSGPIMSNCGIIHESVFPKRQGLYVWCFIKIW